MKRRIGLRWFLTLGAAALTTTLLTTSPAPAANAGAADEDILVIYSAGLDEMLVDEKDAGLRRALEMICERVLELPAEVGEPQMPAEMITQAMQMLGSEMHLRIGLREGADPQREIPFTAQLTVHSDANLASQRAGMVRGLLQQASGGQVSFHSVDGHDGITMFDADGIPAYVGATNVGGRSAFVAAVGSVSDSGVDLAGVLPGTIKPVMAFKLETQHLMPMIDMGLQQAPPAQRDMVRANLAMMGLSGDAPIALSGGLGYTADRSLAMLRVINFTSMQMGQEMIIREPINRAMFAAIPVDATYCEVKRVNFPAVPDMLRGFFNQMSEASGGQMPQGDPFEMAMNMTGIDFEKDFFGALGTTSVSYMSDTTGGGGLASLVGFIEAKDPNAVAGCITQLHEMFMPMLHQEARGYVRFVTRTVDGVDFATLTFPGLPIPLELSFAVTEDKLWYGMSPQAILAGMHQASNSSLSILDNDGFMELAGNGVIDGALSCMYMDSSQLVADGYGLTSALMAALSNAVRSPRNLKRDPGIVMPSFHEFTADVKDSLTISMLDGDDLVIVSQGDRSVLAGVSAGVGMLAGAQSSMLTAGLAAGLLMPAMSKAREQARLTQNMNTLRMVAMAAHVHAADHNDRFPEGLGPLVEGGYLSHESLDSTLGDIYDEHGDIWFNASLTSFGQVTHPDRTVLAYDRASYLNSDRVVVAFVDGHVESMDTWAFHELIESDHHKGVEFHLPSF